MKIQELKCKRESLKSSTHTGTRQLMKKAWARQSEHEDIEDEEEREGGGSNLPGRLSLASGSEVCQKEDCSDRTSPGSHLGDGCPQARTTACLYPNRKDTRLEVED